MEFQERSFLELSLYPVFKRFISISCNKLHIEEIVQ